MSRMCVAAKAKAASPVWRGTIESRRTVVRHVAAESAANHGFVSELCTIGAPRVPVTQHIFSGITPPQKNASLSEHLFL